MYTPLQLRDIVPNQVRRAAEQSVLSHSNFQDQFADAQAHSFSAINAENTPALLRARFRRQFVTFTLLGWTCQASGCTDDAQYFRRPGIDLLKHGFKPGARAAKDVSWSNLRAAIPDHWAWCHHHWSTMMREYPLYAFKAQDQISFFLHPDRSRGTFGTTKDMEEMEFAYQEIVGEFGSDKKFQKHIFTRYIWFPYPADHPIRLQEAEEAAR